MNQELFKIIAEVLDVDVSEVSDESSPESIPSWDSFAGLLLMMEIEKNFKVNFSIEEVVEIKNVGDIKELIKKYAGN